MSTVPRWLMVGGFLAGYAVLCGVNTLNYGVDVIGALVGFVWYAAVFGSTLLVPWVLLPVITNQSRRPRRVLVAVLAGLFPAAVTTGMATYLFTAGDAPPTVLVAMSLSTAAWFVPALVALAYTVARGTSLFTYEQTKIYPAVVAITCVVAPLMVGAFTAPVIALGGWVTRTESPNAEQVAHAREFLLIDPALEIEPLAYYLKDGMDYMVRFKFVAKTNDPTLIFDRSGVDPSTFEADFEFPRGEETHNEAWWDISTRPMSGGYVRVPHGRTLTIGYAENEDGTITVYTWRHEGAFELTQSRNSKG